MPVGVIIIIVAILSLGIYISVFQKKSVKEKSAKQHLFYSRTYKILESFFLTQQKIIKIRNKLSMLSIYNKNEINALSTKYFVIATGVAAAIAIASIILFKSTIAILICILFSTLVNNILIDKQIDNITAKVYRGLSRAISSLRQEYLKLGSVSEAISSAKFDPTVRKPMDEIHTILTSKNGELKLHEFYESTPFRHIQTLAGICYNINNYGDTKDEKGHSNFVQSLTLMSGDINSELQRIRQQKASFGYIEYLPFVALLGIVPFQSFFQSIIPGTALIYEGPLGHLFTTITLMGCIVSYTTISRINSAAAFREDDRDSWVINLLKKNSWRQLILNIMPKGKKLLKLENSMKAVLSKQTTEHLYTKKVIFSIVAIIVSIVSATSIITLGKDFIKNSTQQLSLIATDEMSRYSKSAIQQLDKNYMERADKLSESQIKALITSYMPGLSDLQVLDQIKRLKDKKNSVDNAYFKWWYIWICFGTGLLGWLGPNISLKLRKFLVETEAEEDFLHLQTLISILMNLNVDTIDTLQQLCQHSRVHKDILLYCYHSFPSDPEKELARLKSKTPIIEFKRFIDKLSLTISDLSLREAFSDLIMEREHVVKMREISMKAALERRRGICGPLSLLPVGLFVLGSLLIPLGILGFNEFMNALNSI